MLCYFLSLPLWFFERKHSPFVCHCFSLCVFVVMATEENERNPYEGGTGGKFRKRPFRRAQTTPYDRPPNALRNPNRTNNDDNNNGWFSKLVVDPAQRIIANGARSLFSSLFRKRLPPPPPPPPPPQPFQPSSETNQELRENHRGESANVANNSSGQQQGAVSERKFHIDCSEGGGFTELEKLLKQKTFTRSEIAHLTELLRSRTVDAPTQEEEKSREVVASEPMLPCEPKEEYLWTPAPENVIENRLALTPYFASSDPIEDVASPAELAKAYMGSRPAKPSSTRLGMRSPALRDSPTLLKSDNFPLKSSSITSIVPRITKHAGVHENGFVTPRSRGRSAIYSMARTPYSRIYPTSAFKGDRLVAQGEPSSSTQSVMDQGMLSGSKQQGAIKRRSLALDNDIGSVGPIRRVRHKSNLLYSKDSSLSIGRRGVSVDSAQQPSSSTQKSTQHSQLKLSEGNLNGAAPSTSFPSLPSKSSEMASKILQQLDKLVSPNEKSSESKLSTVNGKSPMKLSHSMLRGQTFHSIEMVDSSKLLDNNQNRKLDVTLGNSSVSAQKFFPKTNMVENGPSKLDAPSDKLVPVVTDAGATKSVDSSRMKSVSYSPQKKRAFHMSAHEDFLDLDDDAYPIGAVPSSIRGSVAMAETTTSSTGAVALDNPPTLFVASSSNGEAHVRSADRSRAGEKVDVSASVTSFLDPTPNPVTLGVTAAAKTSFGSNDPASSNGSVANPSLFNFGNKMVPSTVTSAPSDEITKSGPIFGLGKVPQISATFSSSDTILGSSVSSTTVAGAPDSLLKVHESDKANTEAKTDLSFFARPSEPAAASATAMSSLTSTTGVFTFGHSSTSNQNNGSIATTPTFSTSQNISGSSSLASCSNVSAAAASTGSNMMTIIHATVASSNISSSTPMVAPSSSTTSIFKFGAVPSSSGLPISSSGLEPVETKVSQVSGVDNLNSTAFGCSSAAVGSTGSGIVGFSSPSMKTLNSQSQGSIIGTTASSGSVLGTQMPPATSGFTASTQTQSVSFGSSAPSPSFGLTGSTAFSSGSSLFSSSTPANTAFSSGSLFGSSAPSPSFGLTGSTAASASSLFNSSSPATNTTFSSGSSLFPSSSPSTSIFNSGSTFGASSSASTSAANSVSSNSGTSSTLFGSSSWQPSKSSFGSTFGSSSSSGFSFTTSSASASSPFGTSTASVASTSSPTMFSSSNSAPTAQFSFSSAAATTSAQPAFGTPSSAFTFGLAPSVNNNDHMGMEDSMAEDTIQASPPAAPVFGMQPAPAQSNFVFGAPPPSGTNPFQFGGQQNISPQSPSPFQASGSLEFNAGGSFSLGTGGADKSGRKFVRVKHKSRRK